ncbi:MAG: hypothetical protein MJY79_02955 [Bacteroidaceae bacterium]|nr:hypothetical protein [Bacteroidaceae bacterium]
MKHAIFPTMMLAAAMFAGCRNDAAMSQAPEMFPDYADITIPYNIAPLNFCVDGADQIIVKVSGSKEYRFKSGSSLMQFNMRKWKKMLKAETGSTLTVNITCKDGGNTVQMDPFSWTVVADPVDRYMSYRLIEPAYEVWQNMSIEERDIETFRTRLLGDNMPTDYCCMNCHTTNGSGTSFMHLRGANGGTIVNRNGELYKLNTRTDSTSNGAIYGDISKDGRYAVFAATAVEFAVHSAANKRLEVYDASGDLVVIDLDNLTLTDSPAVKGEKYQESFPCFSVDGRTIFFCRSEHHPQPDSIYSMSYDICAVQFDPATGKVGDKVVTVISGKRHNASFSHLKCSPDGRYLLVTAASFGTFPVWHEEAELWMIDLRDGSINVMGDANSKNADTYHSWSTNSRWVLFASKRDDKVYGRPYFTYIGEDGQATKAFVLPQKNPEYYRLTLKSMNLPEIYPVKEKYNSRKTTRMYNNMELKQVTYKSNF